MGRKSTKESKNIYQELRESLNLTREKASQLLDFISDDRIEKIENNKTLIRPEEVLKMSEVYQNPELVNYYCSHECPIGKKYVPEVKKKELSQITLEMLAILNSLDLQKNRLIEITVDGEISDDEHKDFVEIKRQLDEMSKTIASLSMWVDTKLKK
ncbi:MAG: helix-turn-helix transcriptional regulator [Erysipelotrichaceae bacterium]|nr:helix-turn-helix transcriptional regulator [Erysipelotrichaceae bacterium]